MTQERYKELREASSILWQMAGPENTMVYKMECFEHPTQGLIIAQHFDGNHVELFFNAKG